MPILDFLIYTAITMKYLYKLSFLVALASLLTLGSCSEDENEPPKSDAELIGSGIAWKFSAVTAAGIDASSYIDDCYLDNLLTFNYQPPTNVGVVDSGATKCDDSAPQTTDFTWEYDESTKVLSVDTEVIEIPGAVGEIKVVSVSATQLVLSQSVSLPGFGTQEVVLTLVH